MLACWDCQNLSEFVQVSVKADARQIIQSSTGLKVHSWESTDDRDAGIYCGRCTKPIDADAEALGLIDDRIDFVKPGDFDADDIAEELMSLRPDATWTRLDLPERLPRFDDVPDALHPVLLESLARTGRSKLFTHQASAISAALARSQVVQATSAGSGKSLGFTLPVLDRLLRDPDATAVFLFPLRALANDQMAALERLGLPGDRWVNSTSFDLVLSDETPPIRVARHDGSTPEHERAAIRREARLLVTTPDSLHAAILRRARVAYKDGSSWGRILRGLQFVVLDELHSYQGVFGSNVANVIRRLRRVCQVSGADPQFLAASATIGNPVELAERLTGVSPFVVVDDDGSHRRRRVVLICNPPERSAGSPSTKARATKQGDTDLEADGAEDHGRIAPQTVAIDLLTRGALGSDDHPPVRSIVFLRSRNAVFQTAERTRGALREARRMDVAGAVAAYVATFLADDRVEAEGKLRDGSTLAIVSTNALELGIDIPDLSLAVLVGYPGQISSFRQRIGRAGRGGEGLAVLIVGDDPLQQFLARDPQALAALLEAPAESVVVNPEAPAIVRRYGLAPAQEELGGVAFEDVRYFGGSVEEWLADASGAPAAEHAGAPYWHMPWEGDPHGLALRNAVSSTTYTVMHQSGRSFTPIGVIDEATAPRDAFVPAIWTGSTGELFRVTGFDTRKAEIYCEGPVNVGFQTRGVTVDRVDVNADHLPRMERGGSSIGYGVLAINRQVFSYKEQHFSGVEHSRSVERGWPPVEFITDGLYLHLDPSVIGTNDRDGSVRALEHVLLSVAHAPVACDPYDIDSTSQGTSVFLYDSFGGGLGLTQVLHQRFDELVDLARSVVVSCPCSSGCPSCVMLSRRPDGNRDLSKEGARLLLESLCERGSSALGAPEQD